MPKLSLLSKLVLKPDPDKQLLREPITQKKGLLNAPDLVTNP